MTFFSLNTLYYIPSVGAKRTKTWYVRKSNSGMEPSAIGEFGCVTVAYGASYDFARIICFSRPIWHRIHTTITVVFFFFFFTTVTDFLYMVLIFSEKANYK